MTPRLPELLLRSQSDDRLVSLARDGHDRAFAAIVLRYRAELLALARQLTSDGRAEDLLQQAFLNAFAALRSGSEVHHLRGWLYQIVRNAATKARPATDLALDQVDIAGEPLEESVLRRARALTAMSEIARLPERQRGALVATALGDHAHAEVALSMGISEEAVRQLVHRARATLRGAVTAVTPWPLARWLATGPSAAGPEVAVSVGAVSSTGVAVKLGTLLAATGALATGIAAGPLHQAHPARGGQSAVTHGPARAVVSGSGSGSLETAVVPQVGERAPRARANRDAREPTAPHATTRGVRPTGAMTANAGGAGVENRATRRRGDATGRGREGAGPSENERQTGANSSEGDGAPDHNGRSFGRAGSDLDGSHSGTSGSSTHGSGESAGALVSSQADTQSPGDGGGDGTPTASGVSASGSSVASGDSDGASSSSDGREGGHSDSGADSSVTDTSPKGR